MRVYKKFDGANQIGIAEYDIASATVINCGQVVKLSAGKVVAAAVAETGEILGVAAENHTGAADALNPRSNGTKILVCDCPDAVLACNAEEITATGGTTTTFTATSLGAYAADDFNGGYICYNGKFMEITDYAYSSGTSTFTVATMSAAPSANDTFLLFPPVGLKKAAFATDIEKIVSTGVTMTSMKVVGRDENTKEVLYKAASHF